METEKFDAIVISAGQGGPPLAGRLNSSVVWSDAPWRRRQKHTG